MTGIDELNTMSYSDLSVILKRMASAHDIVINLHRIRELEIRINSYANMHLADSDLNQIKIQLTRAEYRSLKDKLRAPGSAPLSKCDAEDIQKSVIELIDEVSNLAAMTGIDELNGMRYQELGETLERMASGSGRMTAMSLQQIRSIESKFRTAKIDRKVKEIAHEVPVELVPQALENAWLSRILDDIEFNDQRLSTFKPERISSYNKQFIKSDRAHRETTAQRVRRLASQSANEVMNEHPDQAALIRYEARKKRRHMAPRQILDRSPDVLTAIRPCWTMSPILAVQMVSADQQLFDVVIFDEASQIPPSEAIGALARAPQVVIAGDSRQLPPTNFFGTTRDDELEDDVEETELLDDLESLLDVGDLLLSNQMLGWHYRSRDDRLIAFSNARIYRGAMTTFPWPMLKTPISSHQVPYRPILGTRSRNSNPDEVETVVELVFQHARTNPSETLGVIAFGSHHANNIEAAIARRIDRENDRNLETFFSEQNEERFFIKNIETVQGDERDAIILSVGYYKDANGKLLYRFGPLNQDGGERRLNVAVTRARSRMTLVSSFSHNDMDPNRSSAKGVELLRQYLEYAASGGETLGTDVDDVPLNPFELAVMQGLERRGIPVTPQYGVAVYRIDFACAHPEQLGRMVLAIEADGASYHSTPTARDRDRLRQEVLESKGWQFHRIWSTAWFRDSENELYKAQNAWLRAIKTADREETRKKQLKPLPKKPQPAPTPKRDPRPDVPPRGTSSYNSIDDYSRDQLVALVRWIESDTLLRPDDDIVNEIVKELGFKRRGNRIDTVIRDALQHHRTIAKKQQQTKERKKAKKKGRSGPRPDVPWVGQPGYSNIKSFNQTELSILAEWIESDSRRRSIDEVSRLMMVELGFERRGTAIDAALRDAIRKARASSKTQPQRRRRTTTASNRNR